MYLDITPNMNSPNPNPNITLTLARNPNAVHNTLFGGPKRVFNPTFAFKFWHKLSNLPAFVYICVCVGERVPKWGSWGTLEPRILCFL